MDPSTPEYAPAVLCRDAQEALLIGHRALEEEFYKLVLPWSFDLISKCFVGSAEICSSESSSCSDKFRGWEREQFSRPPSRQFWPLVFMQGTTHHLELCGSCETALEDHFLQSRLELWENLPGIFGLPSWEAIATSDTLDV